MGKLTTRLGLENSADAALAARGQLDGRAIRRVRVDAVYHSGVKTVVIPEATAAALGLREIGRKPLQRADGSLAEVPVVTNLRIEILGRDMSCDALVDPAGSRAFIGRLPLAMLGLLELAS